MRYLLKDILHLLRILLILGLLICIAIPKSNAQKRNIIEDYPTIKASLNKKVKASGKNYYLITKSTDSTVHLFWGNSTIKRMYDEDLDLWPAAERLFTKWSNKDYLILEYWTGSGVWVNIVLPMNTKEKTQEFGNALCFDKVYNLLGMEQSQDTILVVENLKTKKDQYIIDKELVCDAGLNCIEEIYIKNKMLFFKWAIPNSLKKKIYKKRVSLYL